MSLIGHEEGSARRRENLQKALVTVVVISRSHKY